MASQQEIKYENCGTNYSDSDYDSDYEDENPEPTWNLPNWKGNAPVCVGCVTRITPTGDTRGCEECDDCWDMPDLSVPLSAADEDEDVFGQETSANYCEGCELLKAGTGGENQMGHACLGYD